MLNLTRPNFEKIRAKLLRQEQKVKEDLKALEKEDPVMELAPAESMESGTDSWLADTHSRVVAMKENLMEMLGNTRRALKNLSAGKYGKCENCGKPIETARLEVMPTATLCIACSKKKSAKK